MPIKKPLKLDAQIKSLKQIDEDKIPTMLRAIEGFVQSRNTMTESEFAHFAPLFQRNREKPLDPKTHQNLERELGNRTSPFDPIRIVSDVGDEEGNHEIILVLPPRANALRPLNVASDVDTAAVVDTFTNKTGDINPLSLDAERATDALMQLTSKTIVDEDIRERNAKLYAIATQQINGEKKVPTSFLEEDESIDDFSELEIDPEADNDEEDIDLTGDDESMDEFPEEED